MASKNKNAKANEKVNMAEGLESVETTTANESGIDYSNLDFLRNNNPTFEGDQTSAKYDEKREPKVQAGLVVIQELMGDQINELILLLGKWWEVKPARAAIKKMIDAEAQTKNVPEDIYMQVNLREKVDMLATIQNAVDRLKYGITYFKPRAGVGKKDQMKQLKIDGVDYMVSLIKLTELKEKHGDSDKGRKALKAELKKVSTPVEIEEL